MTLVTDFQADHRHAQHIREYAALIACTDDPEALAELHERMEADGETFRDHVQALLDYRDEINASMTAIQSEIYRLTKLMTDRALRAERIVNNVMKWMDNCGLQNLMLPRHTLTVRMNPPRVEIYEESLIPPEFMRTPEPQPPILVPDKMAIKKAFDAGVDVPGAKVVQDRRLKI